MSGQQHGPAALWPQERPDSHFTLGWVGPRAGLDGQKIQPVVSRYTDWATRPTHYIRYIFNSIQYTLFRNQQRWQRWENFIKMDQKKLINVWNWPTSILQQMMLKNVWVALLDHLNISQLKRYPTPHHTIIRVEGGAGVERGIFGISMHYFHLNSPRIGLPPSWLSVHCSCKLSTYEATTDNIGASGGTASHINCQKHCPGIFIWLWKSGK